MLLKNVARRLYKFVKVIKDWKHTYLTEHDLIAALVLIE